MVVDHINGNGLDNRKENLRFVTRRQNMQNRHIITNSSKYPGVSWHDSNQKWQARIRIGDKEKYLGVFATEKAAFTAYKEAVNLIGEQVIDFDYRDERQPCSLN
jgi:transcription initiation factor TFIID subunit TAF12